MEAIRTLEQITHWFTGIRLLLIAVLVAAVAIAWQVNVADATEAKAATFTVCSDKQGRLRMAEVKEDCTSNEEFIELDLVTGQALDDAVQGLEEQIDELETKLQGQINDLEQRLDDQAETIAGLEKRIEKLEGDTNGDPVNGDLGDRVTALEALLDGVSRTDDGLTLRFAGMNLR
jgi:chromosome segregation ATPase